MLLIGGGGMEDLISAIMYYIELIGNDFFPSLLGSPNTELIAPLLRSCDRLRSTRAPFSFEVPYYRKLKKHLINAVFGKSR